MSRILAAIVKRMLQSAVLMLVVVTVTFLLSSRIPGDFFSAREFDADVSRKTLDMERQRHGLDQPVAVQYVRWLSRCARLDLGQSLFYARPVREVVLDALGKTMWMGIPALVLGLLGGILLGTSHALHRADRAGIAFDLISNTALALPTMVLGLGALLFAAATHWFPLGSMSSTGIEEVAFPLWLLDRAHHLLLPVACLTLPVLVFVERIQCAAADEVLHQAYVRAARARGVSPFRIFLHYRLRPALTPIVSTAGPLLASILSGSLVLEVIFAWPGLGQVTLNALLRLDLPLVVGCVVGSTLLLVCGNFLADIVLLVMDPRTRAAERSL